MTATSIPPPASLHRALSGPRLALFKKFFKAHNDAEAWGAYQWHEAVRAAALPLVGLLEVTLRNCAHQAFSQMTERVNSTNWYDTANVKCLHLTGSCRRQADELLSALDKATGKPLVQGPDDFVANTSLGFWVETLLQVEKGRTYRLAKTLFPGYGPIASPSTWHSSRAWEALVKIRLRKLKHFRNWLAHFYPLFMWQFEQSGSWRTPSSPGAAMLSLRQEAMRAIQTINEVDPALCSLWTGTFSQAQFMRLTTTRALMAFMSDLPPTPPGMGGDPRYRFLSDLWTTPQLAGLKLFASS